MGDGNTMQARDCFKDASDQPQSTHAGINSGSNTDSKQHQIHEHNHQTQSKQHPKHTSQNSKHNEGLDQSKSTDQNQGSISHPDPQPSHKSNPNGEISETRESNQKGGIDQKTDHHIKGDKNDVSEKAESKNHVVKEDPFAGLSFSVGVAENRNSNYRDKMEDVHTYVANYAEKLDWGYFAIFDGHAGKSTARWCGNNLHALVEEEILASEASAKPYDLRHILCRAFLKADETLDKDGSGSSGSTAAVAVLRWESESGQEDDFSSNSKYDFIPGASHKRVLYTSNVGDSRIVLCRAGRSYRLSYDHKASDPSEMERIREAGGLIVKNRVNGVFAITRSLGDSYIKNLVTGSPFTTATEILAEDEFLILACDGVWDVISDQQACKYVQEVFRQQLEQNGVYDPKAAAKRLCDYAIDNATTDNVTVMVVLLDAGIFSSHTT